eukprot:4879359-Alexandrium_andersonii.AAC.1
MRWLRPVCALAAPSCHCARPSCTRTCDAMAALGGCVCCGAASPPGDCAALGRLGAAASHAGARRASLWLRPAC